MGVKRAEISYGENYFHTYKLKYTMNILVTSVLSTLSHLLHEKIVPRVNFLDRSHKLLLFFRTYSLSVFHSKLEPPVWSLRFFCSMTFNYNKSTNCRKPCLL